MSQDRQPARQRAPRRRRACRAAALALAAVLTVLAVAAAGPQRALAASPASAAVTAATAARLAPASPAPSASPQPAAAAGTGTGGCGFLDVTCYVSSAITGWFASLVRSAVNPLLALIGQSALSTPQPGAIPAVRTMWATSVAVADACYVLLVLIGAIVVMSHETLQTSYSVKEIAPRIVLGFLGANLSMTVMSQAITIANGLSAALAGRGVTPASAAKSLLATLANSASDQGAFLVLLALAGVVLALVLAVVYVMRLMAVVLLAAAAPLCLALYALPQTAWAARWWWRALTAALAIQVAQGLVMTAAVQVFFSPGWLPGDISSTLGQTLITLCLLYILMRIPFWIARPVLSPFGRSPLRRAARFVVTAAILSRVGPLLRGTATASRGTAGRTSGRRAGGTRAGARRAPGTGSSGWSWQASPAPPPAPRTPPGVAGPPARPPGGRPALPPAPPSSPSGP
jgi:hypothetical protein